MIHHGAGAGGAVVHGGAGGAVVHGGAGGAVIHGGAGGAHIHGGAMPVGGGVSAGLCGTGGGVMCGSAGASAGCAGGNFQGGSLTYVGTGGGDFVAETTYKYVGVGHGDLAFSVQKRSWLPLTACLVLLLVILVVLILMNRGVITTTTSMMPVPRMSKECLFWGDPHVATFDGGRPSFYGEGEFWIVKNPRVSIQGRYAGTKYTLGLASTQKVVITGSFIGGHKIEVEPMELEFGGQIRVDGEVVLQQFGSVSVGGATINYNAEGELVDQATSKWERKIVHMDLPEGIHMEVFRWGNYMDLRIRMSPLEGGQDGSCGNFNDVVSDDSTEAIFNRIGARIPNAECAFTRRTPVDFTRPMAEMLRTCPPATKSQVEDICARELGSNIDPKLLSACMFDRCFGMNEHALQTAKTFATQQELQDGSIV